MPRLATCLERVAARSGHGFTDPDATRRMYREFRAAGVAARHLLTDAVEPSALVDRIGSCLRDGSLRLRGD